MQDVGLIATTVHPIYLIHRRQTRPTWVWLLEFANAGRVDALMAYRQLESKEPPTLPLALRNVKRWHAIQGIRRELKWSHSIDRR